MGNNIRIQKTVYNKDVYDKIVDRKFSAFNPTGIYMRPADNFYLLQMII
mgnify:CR=1 FL=1